MGTVFDPITANNGVLDTSVSENGGNFVLPKKIVMTQQNTIFDISQLIELDEYLMLRIDSLHYSYFSLSVCLMT